jgi:hypothetical protein
MPRPAPSITRQPTERGSVLFYIFIAIAALAALSFAASRGGREGASNVDRERAELLATQILDYTGMIRRSIQAMGVDGIDVGNMCFDSTRWGHADYSGAPGCVEDKNRIFHADGGGAIWQDMTKDIFDQTFVAQPGFGKWVFSGANAVFGVGTDCVAAGNPDCNELLMALPYVKPNICLALNKRLQNTTGTAIPVDDPEFDIITEYVGDFSIAKVLNTAALHGKRSGCFQANGTPPGDPLIFFAVLNAR